jgi:aminomethyltransferase
LPDHLPDPALKTTPLDALHRRLGARMVPFAGYAMPVQYPAGVLAEHLHCRAKAALFDVSHMGQATLHGPAAAAALERMVPGDIQGLRPQRQRYTLLLADDGGIIDDLMVANYGDRLRLVVNASRKTEDYAHLAAHLPDDVVLEPHDDRALLALQGPLAGAVLARLSAAAAALPFMAVGAFEIAGAPCWVSRSGYTGEDGFEISVPAADAEAFAERLLAEPEVAPAGLGARDSLRLEAGLCLYGSDIDLATDPVEAGLVWTIGKRRRMAWDFAGAAAVRARLDGGPARLRIGLRPDGRAPARAGTAILAPDGKPAGHVTSGGFAPSLGVPVAMGYVRRDLAGDGTKLLLEVRGRHLPATVVPMPFVPHRYLR